MTLNLVVPPEHRDLYDAIPREREVRMVLVLSHLNPVETIVISLSHREVFAMCMVEDSKCKDPFNRFLREAMRGTDLADITNESLRGIKSYFIEKVMERMKQDGLIK